MQQAQPRALRVSPSLQGLYLTPWALFPLQLPALPSWPVPERTKSRPARLALGQFTSAGPIRALYLPPLHPNNLSHIPFATLHTLTL